MAAHHQNNNRIQMYNNIPRKDPQAGQGQINSLRNGQNPNIGSNGHYRNWDETNGGDAEHGELVWRTMNGNRIGEQRNGGMTRDKGMTGGGAQQRTAVAAIRPQPKAMLQQNGTMSKQKAPEAPPPLLNSHYSEYTLLSELPSKRNTTEEMTEKENIQQQQNRVSNGTMKKDDDSHSMADTDFNEPWDSNAWENLLDLARFGDGRTEENSPRVSEIDSDNLAVMEKAAAMATCTRTNFPHLTGDAHRRSMTRVRGSSSLMDMSRIGSSSDAGSPPVLRTHHPNGAAAHGGHRFNFSHPQHHHHNHHQPAAAACSSSVDELASHQSRSTTICPSITPVFSPSRLRNVAQEHPGEEDPAKIITRYVEAISTDDQTIFGATLQRFVECTMLSKQQDPYVMIRRVRQFLDGMKNYLMKNGEADLHAIIERESDRLHADEFLNIDGILEAVLNKLLLVRVKAQLYRLMILESTRNGELRKLSENLAHIRAMSSVGLGFAEGQQMPDAAQMEQISKQLRKMQNHYSPLRKLQLLLRVLAMVVPHPLSSSSPSGSSGGNSNSHHHPHHHQHQHAQQSASSSNSAGQLMASPALSSSRHRTGSGSSSVGTAAAALKHPPADELIRWLVYLLARSSTINCELEAWYMWELLPQQVLSTGDAAYFLSILFSAIHVLKHPDAIRRLKNVVLPNAGPVSAPVAAHLHHSIADFMGSQSTLDTDDTSDLLLRVAIPNEQEGTIEYHTFPVLPKMNAAKLCRVIAHQFSVSNPEDYRLYVLFNGHETGISPNEYPHLIRDQLRETGKPLLFAYKRAEACIAWPRQAVSGSGSNTALAMMAAATPASVPMMPMMMGAREGGGGVRW